MNSKKNTSIGHRMKRNREVLFVVTPGAVRAGCLALIMLTAFGAPAFAQNSDSGETESKEKTSQQAIEKTTAEASTKSAPAKPTKIKAQSAQSADNYEATEEISEDLSVSYPIDI